ncbi:HlyD family secretion protein [uncultured archaeon]|nr:HlyD family secretion protein [uncultured archaeon]
MNRKPEYAHAKDNTHKDEGTAQEATTTENGKPPGKKGPLGRVSRPMALKILGFLVLVAAVAILTELRIMDSRVSIEKAEIYAPIISLSPSVPGTLDKIKVNEGDVVHKNTVVAEVGGIPIRAQTNGIIVAVTNTPGQIVSAQTPVVQMIDPREFRVVGRIEEDKGLSEIRVGQKVVFTVDAFGPKEYNGVIDSISPTSRESDIVFSISDKRQEKEFDVKATFDGDLYPELRNGMSAKMLVYK